jgi:hypothetical protein
MSSALQPKRTLAECKAILGGPGMPHETETILVDGRVVKVYKNIQPVRVCSHQDQSAV